MYFHTRIILTNTIGKGEPRMQEIIWQRQSPKHRAGFAALGRMDRMCR